MEYWEQPYPKTKINAFSNMCFPDGGCNNFTLPSPPALVGFPFNN